MSNQHPSDQPKTSSRQRTIRLFRNGSNQAVRLPREFELDAEEVIIQREGNRLILTPVPRSWEDYFVRRSTLDSDFPDAIEDAPAQSRDAF